MSAHSDACRLKELARARHGGEAFEDGEQSLRVHARRVVQRRLQTAHVLISKIERSGDAQAGVLGVMGDAGQLEQGGLAERGGALLRGARRLPQS